MTKPSLKAEILDGWRATPLFARALIGVLSVVTVYCLVQNRRLARAAQGRTAYLVAELQAVKENHDQEMRYFALMTEEFAQIRDTVRPLQNYAIEKYRESDPLRAIERLTKELGVAQAQLASAPYRSLTRWLRQKTLDELGLALRGAAQNGAVVVSLGRTGDNQFPLSSDVTRILRDAGLSADPGPRDERWADGMKRLRFLHGQGGEDLARRLSEGLKPFLKGEREVTLDPALAPGSVRLVLHGTPQYASDGAATF